MNAARPRVAGFFEVVREREPDGVVLRVGENGGVQRGALGGHGLDRTVRGGDGKSTNLVRGGVWSARSASGLRNPLAERAGHATL
jgi:hypothetical protein